MAVLLVKTSLVGTLADIYRIGTADLLSMEGFAQKRAENLVAPVPGDFVQERVVRPMFSNPGIGLAFAAVFPLCFGLGLIGRVRQEVINSNRWRHLEIVRDAKS